MNMLMKSMRETLPKDGMLDSSTSQTYTGMFDQQIAQKLSERGVGLADLTASIVSSTVPQLEPEWVAMALRVTSGQTALFGQALCRTRARRCIVWHRRVVVRAGQKRHRKERQQRT